MDEYITIPVNVGYNVTELPIGKLVIKKDLLPLLELYTLNFGFINGEPTMLSLYLDLRKQKTKAKAKKRNKRSPPVNPSPFPSTHISTVTYGD